MACSELTCIGENWPGAVEAVNVADNGTAYFEGKTLRPLAGWGAQFDYAAFVKGEDEVAESLCAMAVVAFNAVSYTHLAPAHVVEAERERSVKLSELVSKLTEQLKSM